MSQEKALKTETRKFMKKDVRVVFYKGEMWVVLRDCFEVLGRVDEDGNWQRSKEKIEEFLVDIDKLGDKTKCLIASKSKKKYANKTVKLDCLKVERLSSVITQFRPQKGKEEQLKVWREFMKMVDDLLEENKMHRFLIHDKEHQKLISDYIAENTDEKMVAINNNVSIIMAKICDVYPEVPKLNKPDLKTFQTDTSIDLLQVREEVLEIYQQQLLMDISKSVIHENIIKFIKKKYNL